MISRQVIFFLGILLSLVYRSSSICDKTPSGVVKPRNRNEAGKYLLEIPGNPQSYTPLQRYNISLKISPRVHPKAFRSFMITLEPDDGENEDHAVGQLGFAGDTEMLARISNQCPNTVVESSIVPKTEIQMYWIAPPKGSGCIAIKATVVESKENWFSEDGPLTKRLCEETLQNENIEPTILRRCCACDEAKYEMEFEGKWTRNTHPSHFPIDQWNTRFSDVIGASHQLHHAFWNYEDLASQGLTELAETGVTRTLESELKNNSEHIRTIIKARGLQYPYITKSTYAVFRVDSKNHLVSLVSKITPSPDWIVGVSNLELCKEDCTWEESRTLNLYPWDVGTNDGLRYDSSVPTRDRQPIRRITPNNPNDPNSPFYSKDGEDMKPIAKLHLTRQRIYTKSCEYQAEDESDCATKEWSDWSPCSATCGDGIMYRQRTFIDPDNAEQCHKVRLTESQTCFSRYCFGSEEMIEKEGIDEEMESEKEPADSAQDIRTCGNGNEDCEEDPNCPGTFWGKWSGCNVTCGKGTKERRRIRMKDQEDDDDDDQGPNCASIEYSECHIDCNNEDLSKDVEFGGLGSNSIIISQGPVGKVIDCKVSKWSRWSECILPHSSSCGEGYKYRDRKITRHQANGGNECPKDLKKVKRCTVPCTGKCLMSNWSNWTPCSSNCGGSAVQIRTRQILYKPSGVDNCPAREEKKACRLPLACTEDGQPIFNR